MTNFADMQADNLITVSHLTPIGPIEVTLCDTGIVSLDWSDAPAGHDNTSLPHAATGWLGQLDEYFAGKRREFNLPILTSGTPFQEAVWRELRKIPYGETASYSEIARAIGRPRAFRAVAQACHVNPIAIIIPCHRVIGADGSLTGYAAGLEIKRQLLGLEHRVARIEVD